MQRILIGLTALVGLAVWAAIAYHKDAPDKPSPVRHSVTIAGIEIPAGLPSITIPKFNALTEEKIAAGRKAFFDRNLSIDRTISCASCHDPEKNWTNGKRYGTGIGGAQGTRNVPSLANVAYHRQMFWDGRAANLEKQVLFPILDPNEMGMPTEEKVLERLKEDDEYQELFAAAFPDGVTITNLTFAIASFQRTLLAGNAPYDRYIAGDVSAMSKAAIRGLNVFLGRGRCNGCHFPPTFIDHSFHNLGVGMDELEPDLGRFNVFHLESTKGNFKTPTLRDVALTAPYMHDGSMETLMETVEIYDQGGIKNPYLSSEVNRRLRLTDQEKADLVTFMVEGLTSDVRATGNVALTDR